MITPHHVWFLLQDSCILSLYLLFSLIALVSVAVNQGESNVFCRILSSGDEILRYGIWWLDKRWEKEQRVKANWIIQDYSVHDSEGKSPHFSPENSRKPQWILDFLIIIFWDWLLNIRDFRLYTSIFVFSVAKVLIAPNLSLEVEGKWQYNFHYTAFTFDHWKILY